MLFNQITCLSFFFALAGALPLSAQTARDSVTLALNDYIDAFYYGDTSKLHRSVDLAVHK